MRHFLTIKSHSLHFCIIVHAVPPTWCSDNASHLPCLIGVILILSILSQLSHFCVTFAVFLISHPSPSATKQLAHGYYDVI